MRKLLASLVAITALILSASATASPLIIVNGYPVHWSSNFQPHSITYENDSGYSEYSSEWSDWDGLLSNASVSSTSGWSNCAAGTYASAIDTICTVSTGAFTCAETRVTAAVTTGGQSHFTYTRTLVKSGSVCGGTGTSAQRQMSACHENGHSLGLDHYPTATSCMNTTIGSSPITAPNSDDVTTINNLYNHSDSTGCCSPMRLSKTASPVAPFTRLSAPKGSLWLQHKTPARVTITFRSQPIGPFNLFGSTRVRWS